MRSFHFSIESPIHNDSETIWSHITQMRNVNMELMPYARMTFPKDRSEIGDRELPLGKTLFKSIVLLFGFIPVDVHCLRFDRIESGKAFYENSVTAMHIYWKHTRTLIKLGDHTQVLDIVEFLPRIYTMGYVLLPFIEVIFKNRHRKLAEAFA